MFTKLNEDDLERFKTLFNKQGISYDSEDEYREAASNLLGYFDILIQISAKEQSRKRRLEQEPKGFETAGDGRNCSLCHIGVYETKGWYDKWGSKCMNCQDAVNKKKIPGSLCGDYDHKKCISDISLSYKAKLHTQTIRKLIRNGSITASEIPNGPFMILRKDNPNLKDILEKERQPQPAKTQTARA